MTDLASLPVSAIQPNPGQPRKHFDAASLDELATSIRTYGLLEPIIVRGIAAAKGVEGHYQIIAGERRWRAAQMAGLERIPVVIRDETDADAFELSMIENIVRADMTPIEEADGYQRLVDSGLDVGTIAHRTGKPAASITARLKLLSLAGPIRDLVHAGQLDCWSAGHLTKLSHEGQYRVIRARSDGLPIHDVARLASAIHEVEAQVGAFTDLEMIVADAPAPKARPTIDAGAELARLERLARAIDSGAAVPDTFAADLTALAARITKTTRRTAMRAMAAASPSPVQ